jgi:V/A-type H+-transporting ATPase subunit I
MLVPMAKVEIIGPKGLFFDVLGLVHEQGRLHIEDLSNKISRGEVPLDSMEVADGRDRERDVLDEMLIRVRSILKALDRGGPEVDRADVRTVYERLCTLDADALRDEVSKVIEDVEDRTATLAATHTDLESEMELLARYEPILQKIQPLARKIVTTGSYDSVALLFERRYKVALDTLKEELDRITHKQYEVVSTDVDEETTAAIVVFSKQYSDPVHKFLAVENINQIRLPSEFEGMPFDSAYDEIKTRRKTLPAELEEIRTELDEMSKQWRTKLIAIRDVLIDRCTQLDVIPKFGRTAYAFVITGWMPIDDVPMLKEAIAQRWKEDVIVEQTEVREDEYENTPVALKNDPRMAPFQTLLSVYGTPRYGTMDPTWMLFVFYPLFFGMIIGDIGYGVIMLSVVLWLRFKFRENQGIQIATSILGPAATMVIAFGFLYAEMFGDLLGHYLGWVRSIHIGALELPFDRVQLVIPFMLVAISVGVVHVLLGLVFGVVNAIKTKNKHHLWEKGGILAFLLGVIAAVAASLPFVTGTFGNWATGAQVLFAVVAFGGFIFALRGGKVMGVIELVESVAHIVSYIRIMAVGLMGAIFADAVNSIAARMMSSIPIAAVLIAVVLHSLNLVIAAFSPTIHALRLNFLEFFGKFYETGNQEYSPFRKTGGEKSV